MSVSEAVTKFMTAAKQEVPEQPTLIGVPQYQLRHDLMAEELTEYLEACKACDLVEVADAITDMLYVLVGTALSHGINGDTLTELFGEVHRSNMSKLTGGQLIRSDTGKILKPDTYSPPDLWPILARASGYEVKR